MKNIIIIMIILLSTNKVYSKQIWIYADEGTWIDGIIAFEQFLNHSGIEHRRIYSNDLNQTVNFNECLAICFPGGYSYYYQKNLNDKAISDIRNYVATGGSYIGICAGAYFACSQVDWEGVVYPYKLSLFDGSAIGSIHNISPWDNYTMTSISINKSNPIIKDQNFNHKFSTLYYGGAYFTSNSTGFDIVATYDSANNMPAAINFTYKNGKVLLIGPHFEIEENSDRDSTSFAEILSDDESEWELLDALVDWTLGKNDTISSLENSAESSKLSIYPNPASDYIEVKSENRNPREDKNQKIYNSLGECVMELPYSSLINRIEISRLPVGFYYIRNGASTNTLVITR